MLYAYMFTNYIFGFWRITQLGEIECHEWIVCSCTYVYVWNIKKKRLRFRKSYEWHLSLLSKKFLKKKLTKRLVNNFSYPFWWIFENIA